MTRIELSADQRAALKDALKQVADGGQVILTAEGVELAAIIPMSDLEPQQEKTARTEEPATLADFLKGYVGILHSSEYAPGGARMSEDSGRKFAEGLAAQRQQKKS
jgi:prevent-host-death family protein